MREIKFRVWHLWGEGFSILSLAELCSKPKKFHGTYYKNSIEQFTGLQDCKGVDIYKGDVVSDGQNVYTVVFGKIGYDDNHNGLTGFGLKERYHEECDMYEICFNDDYKKLEVIGDIHDKGEDR